MDLLNTNYLENNNYFINNIKRIYPHTGEKWLNNIRTQLMELQSQWDFSFLTTLPGLSYSFVALVKYRDQVTILKMVPPEQCLEREIQCLSSFQQNSPVVFYFDKKYNATLMEYIRPGTSLKNLVADGLDNKATEIICELIIKLRFQNEINYPFKQLSELGKDLNSLVGHFDKKLLNKAISLFDELTQNHSADILLHGDLHHANILSSSDKWKIIDPHGYIGDPAAEVGAMIRNPYDCLPDVGLEKLLSKRLSILNYHLPYDKDRINAWCYCLSVLSVAWTYEGFNIITDSDIELIITLDKVCF